MQAQGPVGTDSFAWMHIKQNRIGPDVVLLRYRSEKGCQQTIKHMSIESDLGATCFNRTTDPIYKRRQHYMLLW